MMMLLLLFYCVNVINSCHNISDIIFYSQNDFSNENESISLSAVAVVVVVKVVDDAVVAVVVVVMFVDAAVIVVIVVLLCCC